MTKSSVNAQYSGKKLEKRDIFVELVYIVKKWTADENLVERKCLNERS